MYPPPPHILPIHLLEILNPDYKQFHLMTSVRATFIKCAALCYPVLF